MKNKYFIIISTLLFFFSCKKNGNDAPSALTNKIKKVIFISPNNNFENEYFYDNNGRVNKFIASNGSISEYTYEPGKVLTKTTNANGVFYSISELNSRGLGVTMNSADGSSFISYSINSIGYLEKEVSITFTNGQPSFTQTIAYFYNVSTGLVDSVVFNVNNNKSTSIYTAYSSYPDNLLKNTGNFHIAPSSKFLPLEVKSRSSNDPPNFFRIAKYSYEFDNKNRLSKRTIVSQNTTSTTQYDYYD